MRINVHAGHCPAGQGASGAVGILNESVEDRIVKNRVISALRNAGHTVYDCTDDSNCSARQNLYNIAANCNSHSVDLDVSIHLNAGGGTGSEVWVTGNHASITTTASRISSNISAQLGIPNRGVKYTANFYILNHTNAPALLIECAFVDNATDANHWNANKCGDAIASAINGSAIQGSTSTPAPSAPVASGKLAVDGSWGPATTMRMQNWLGTIADGIVSNQPIDNKTYLPNCDESSWQFRDGRLSSGSNMAAALQAKVGATVDGWFGKQSVMALQRFLGVTVDGSCGPATVSALQAYLNNH